MSILIFKIVCGLAIYRGADFLEFSTEWLEQGLTERI